jgi:hypothetical protein
VKMLSKMVKKWWCLLQWMPCMSWFTPSSSPCPAVCHSPGRVYESCRFLRRVALTVIFNMPWAERVSWHTLTPVILHFGGNIGNGSLCAEMPLFHCYCLTFYSFAFLSLIFAFSSRLVTLDLRDNFLKFLHAFSGCLEQMH